MSWLINSMNNDIGEFSPLRNSEGYMGCCQRNLIKQRQLDMFEIESNLHDLCQREFSVTHYYNTLTRYWQQLGECPKDGMKFRKIVEQKRVFKFLLGLNQNLDEVRGRILGTKPFPNIREVFFEVRREKSRKKVMMGSMTTQSATESTGSALATRVHGNQQRKGSHGATTVADMVILKTHAGKFMVNQLVPPMTEKVEI